MHYKSVLQLIIEQAIKDSKNPNFFKTQTFWVVGFYLIITIGLIAVIITSFFIE